MQYSADYFSKKYKILFERLLKKEGFIDAIKTARKELYIPVEKGFTTSSDLAEHLLKKLTKSEKESVLILSFIERFEVENHIRVSENDRENFFRYFMKNKKGKDSSIAITLYLQGIIEDHNNLFTSNAILREYKFFSKLSPIVFKLFNKYWGVDLLDEWVTVHFVEKYLFLGEGGVNHYIREKVNCHHCKYIGVDHFSPDRHDMQGKDEGAFSKNYIFNKRFVSRLSRHFNSVFLIIKPYATKELVIQYIKDNWDDLKEHIIEKNTFYKQFDVHPSIIKESDDEKNRLVYELNKLSKKELLKRYKGENDFSHKGVYKEAIVSAILDEEYNIKMSSDAVKKSASRFAKSIKVQRTPKDIGDI